MGTDTAFLRVIYVKVPGTLPNTLYMLNISSIPFKMFVNIFLGHIKTNSLILRKPSHFQNKLWALCMQLSAWAVSMGNWASPWGSPPYSHVILFNKADSSRPYLNMICVLELCKPFNIKIAQFRKISPVQTYTQIIHKFREVSAILAG